MRTSLFFALGVIFLTLFTGSSALAANRSNTENKLPQPTNYVVIGAFAKHKNAINFTASAKKSQNLDARYEMNFNRNLYYVYVMTTGDKVQAIEEALRLRKETPYFDTWVFSGLLGEKGENVIGEDINPVTSRSYEEEQAPQQVAPTEVKPVETPVEEKKEESPTVTVPETEEDDEIEGKRFFFKIYRGDNAAQVEGDVNVIDITKARKMGTYAGNKPVKISSPPSKEGNISLVCEVFGYRKVQHDLNYNNPEGEGVVVNETDGVSVPFELVRLQKGDHAIMYNVFFFKDAAIMRPESRYEVNSLLEMLKENTKYKIKIHGHTNGNSHGKIISLEEGATNYFSLNNTKDGAGSAKKLSGLRAEVIRDYLISNGIDAARMEIKAWGGKRALYDKHSPQAQSNVRVEIEILDN